MRSVLATRRSRIWVLTGVTALVCAIALTVVIRNGSSSASSAGCDPRVIDMGTLPGGTASGIYEGNSHGDWVGSSDDNLATERAVIWQAGHIVKLAVPGPSDAYDINNHGLVIGVERTNSIPDPARAFAWIDGHASILPGLPGIGTGWTSYVRRVNDHGLATGSITNTLGYETPVVWNIERGTVRALPVPQRFNRGGTGMWINDHGQIVGTVQADQRSMAYEWDGDGTGHALATIDKSGWSAGNVLDDHGIAAGGSDFGGQPGSLSAFWSDGVEKTFGSFGNKTEAFVFGTNGAGVFVGAGDYFPESANDTQEGHVFITSVRNAGTLLTLMPLSGDQNDASNAHAATVDPVDVGGESTTSSGQTHATVWTCAWKQAFVPDVGS